ncbi:MAG: group 1 truncated hemoglobin [Betaproteobacteria bacterium]|nr:group 1 truncated hemoglobin [Betaproteobacteria bacterium]
MAKMVCEKCGVASDEAKPLRCVKCGGKSFYESKGSAFASKPASVINPAPESPAVPAYAEPSASNVTLFDKYGGVPTIAKLVRAFHKEIMNRHHLAAYFDGIDMAQLAEHTVKYMAYVMGKPAEIYTGRDMYTAHAKFHIHGIHFDEVADVLKDILVGAGVAKPDVALIMRRVESVREMIVV